MHPCCFFQLMLLCSLWFLSCRTTRAAHCPCAVQPFITLTVRPRHSQSLRRPVTHLSCSSLSLYDQGSRSPCVVQLLTLNCSSRSLYDQGSPSLHRYHCSILGCG